MKRQRSADRLASAKVQNQTKPLNTSENINPTKDKANKGEAEKESCVGSASTRFIS
jgi:hypothetical protein